MVRAQDDGPGPTGTDAPSLRRILVVDDEENLRHMLTMILRRQGYEVGAAASASEALAEVEARPWDVVLADIRMPGKSGLELLELLVQRNPAPTVIVMSAYGSFDVALDAMKKGAYDYISKPFKPDEIVLVLRKAEERERLKRENRALREALARQDRSALLVAQSPAMKDVLRTVHKLAEYKSTVLITGESGTGKELVARMLHEGSPRRDAPFVAVNCGAIPETLLESELFGYKKGAFTDASRDRKGLFEQANGGTILLDEIGEMPLALQVKLLRVLQEEAFRPLGDTRDVEVDVRVVAATARELAQEVTEGRFREDLFYRLNVLPVRLPPLRDRKEDIPALVEHFVARANERLGTQNDGVTPSALKLLMAWSWPGNVRELENTIERAVVLCEGSKIGPEDLPERLRESRDPLTTALSGDELSIKKTGRALEQALIRRALQRTGGNRTAAARLLELSHRALLYKIKEYGITDS